MAKKTDISVIGYGIGWVHRQWIRRPYLAAGIALTWHLGVLAMAWALGIHKSFKIDSGSKTVQGFYDSHWAILFLLAMPLATLLTGQYLRVLDRSLKTLDTVVKPVDRFSEQLFTKFLAERIRLHWSAWIFPLAFILPLLLTVVADGNDVIAPLKSSVVSHSSELDWSNLGYRARHAEPSLWYFLFNLAAWSMQIFLGYAGIMLLLITGTSLGLVFRYGLGGKKALDLFRAPGSSSAPEEYRPEWDFTDKRCGLGALDWTLLVFFIVNLMILSICGTSILSNVFLKGGADTGSSILALATMLVVPLSIFWVYLPYFVNFPSKLPAEQEEQPNFVEPSPWPFGSENLAKWVIGVTIAVWLALFMIVLQSYFPGFKK